MKRTRSYDFSRRQALGLAVSGAASALVSPAGSLASASRPTLSIQGYDPVAYFTTGRPTPGSPQIVFEWDEHLFRFASVEHREVFKANPVRYAPQFANLCAMALTRGEVLEANPEYWLISGGKLYIFGKPIGPELFQQDLAGNVAKAGQNWALTRSD